MLCDALSGRSIRAAKRLPKSLQMAKKTPWCPTSPRMSGSRPRNGSATATVHVAARSSPGPQAEQPLHCVQTGARGARSYCIIPQTRGHSRSRPLGQVIDDVHCAITAGYKEIAITGVHLGSYGRDLHDGLSLARLVLTLAEIDDDVVFRISSLEPMDCTDDIVEIVASSSRLAPHFHLPLQNGSTKCCG